MSEAKRGRKGIEVTAQELQSALSILESSQEGGCFPTRNALWAALEQTEWAKTRSPRPLTAQVAMLMAKKHNTTIATPVGRRGRQKGCAPISVKGGRKRKQLSPEQAKFLYDNTPKKFHKIVDKIVAGSMKARIKRNCLECCGWEREEARNCGITSCSFYAVRAYRTKEEKNDAKISLPLVAAQAS